MHEVLGGAGEKKNGPNRSTTLALHGSQWQAGRARRKLAAWVSAAHRGFQGTYLWLGTPISVRPQPYWISPWKCLFLSPSPPKTHLALLSHHYLLRNSLRRHPQVFGWKGHGVGRERQREECGVAATLFSSLVVLMAWNGVRISPQCCVIAT